MPEQAVGKLPVYTLRVVGGTAVAFAGLGLWHLTLAVSCPFPYNPEPEAMHFTGALYAMLVISALCLTAQLLIGVLLLRAKTLWVRPFIGVMIAQFIVIVAPGLLMPFDSAVAVSVRAANGVTIGPMMFQSCTLFPIWGALLALWAQKQIEYPRTYNDPFAYQERIARTTDWLWASVDFIIVFVLCYTLVASVYSAPERTTDFAGIVLLISGCAAMLSVRLRRKRRRTSLDRTRNERLAHGLCPRCEYDLTGNTSGVCPDCGGRYPCPSE